MKRKLNVDVGIFAHNEEANIQKAVESVLASKLSAVEIKRIVVVSSGSLDLTNQIVKRIGKKDKRVKLIVQTERQGKASAVNLFLMQAKAPILITLSADLVTDKGAIEAITIPFRDKNIGMVGSHPIPRAVPKGKLNREIKLLWQLHHEVSLIKPKCGEMVAFRNIIRMIPVNSAVDEANIEVLLTLLGYHVAYAKEAIVYNRGPKNFREFLLQRRRVQAGHHWVLQKYNYKVATLEPNRVLSVVINHIFKHPEDTRPMIRLLAMEFIARTMGYLDFHLWGRNPYNWQMIPRR